MRYPRSFATAEERILFALDAAEGGEWVCQTDVIRLARMDTSTAISALKALTHSGAVQWSKLFRGRGQGSGRPAYLYRRVRQEAAA